jgi:predicted SprT family Zn-dependent metalloprotease
MAKNIESKVMAEGINRRTFLSAFTTSLLGSVLASHSGVFGGLKPAYGYEPAADVKPRYADFLEIISDDRFNVYPVIEYDVSYREDKVNVILRHDADNDNGYGIAKLDYDAGIRSTFYLRLHAGEYQLEDVAKFYQSLESAGYEIGYHYEVMDLCDTVTYNGCVRNLFTLELAKMRKYFNIRSVAPHGGDWNYLLDRSPVWPTLSRRYNVISAYQIPFRQNANHSYLSDCGQAFSQRKLEYFRSELEKLKPGDVAQVLVHPHPPRWEYQVYQNHEPPSLQTLEMPETSVPMVILTCASAVLLTLFKRKISLGTVTNSVAGSKERSDLP